MQTADTQSRKSTLLEGKIIIYSDRGEGDAIILLHGYLESHKIWGDFAGGLSENHRVICPDLPGHGESELSSEVQTMEASAAAIKRLADALGIDKFLLVGHSLGGYVALAFLEAYPEYLSGLCLFHSHPLPDAEATKEKRKREIILIEEGKKELIYNANIPNAFAVDNLKSMEEEVEYAKAIAKATPDAGIVATLKGMMERKDNVDLLASTELPFLWILGRKDNYIPFPDIMDKVKMPAAATIAVLDNSGHQGFMEEPGASLQLITGFADGL